MTLHEHLRTAGDRLAAAGIDPDEAARDAALLARHALGWDAASLAARRHDPAPPAFAAAFDALVSRRAAREPVAYIRGVQEFWGRAFAVGPGVLIPRPETELIIETALAMARAGARVGAVADVGTGSGCLAVTLAAECPGARIVATDISAAALAVARANAGRHHAADRIVFREGAYLAGAAGPFDLVVANPPYVADADLTDLAPEVGLFEPSAALAAGPDGLDHIRALLRVVPSALRAGGTLLMEIGCGQGDAVRALVAADGRLGFVDLAPDLQAIPRVLVARRA